jgi:hypothetical protein
LIRGKPASGDWYGLTEIKLVFHRNPPGITRLVAQDFAQTTSPNVGQSTFAAVLLSLKAGDRGHIGGATGSH